MRSREALLSAHRTMWRRAFSPALVAERLGRGVRRLGPGGLMLSATMNGFDGWKQLRGNLPKTAPFESVAQIPHPKADAPPVRLSQAGDRRGFLKRAHVS